MDDEAELSGALAWLKHEMPTLNAVEVFAITLNGIPRGKRVPLSSIETLAADGAGSLRFQTSLLGLDIFGADVPASGIAMEIGDPDGVVVPLPHTLKPLPFSDGVGTLQGMLADAPSGALSAFDPRAVLLRVVERVRAAGLDPVIAPELEFYLIDPQHPLPARHPSTNARLSRLQVMDLDVLGAFGPVINDIEAAAATLGARTQTVLSEFGAGQFEINLPHGDAALACDGLIALKRAIRAAARHHGLDATFMAKPFGGSSGSGMHCHVSLKDLDGRNVFDEEGAPVGKTLVNALGGLQASARDTFLLLAPHLNSFRRFRPGSYAPLSATWGLDNRGAAFRVPANRGAGARVEHRVAGADGNPYLVAAAAIASAVRGIEEGLSPSTPSVDECGTGPAFPRTPVEAIDAFAQSDFVATWFGAELRHVFAAMKAQEFHELQDMVSDVEHQLYLRTL